MSHGGADSASGWEGGRDGGVCTSYLSVSVKAVRTPQRKKRTRRTVHTHPYVRLHGILNHASWE